MERCCASNHLQSMVLRTHPRYPDRFHHYYFTPTEAASKPVSKDALILEVNGKPKTYELPKREHFKVVPNMYKSILVNGGTKTKITVKCHGEEQKEECKDAQVPGFLIGFENY